MSKVVASTFLQRSLAGRRVANRARRCALVASSIFANVLDQAGLVHRPDLIQGDLTRFPLELNWQAGGVGTVLGRHGGHDDGVEMVVSFRQGK